MLFLFTKAGSVIPRAKLFVVDAENPSKHSEVVVPKPIGVGCVLLMLYTNNVSRLKPEDKHHRRDCFALSQRSLPELSHVGDRHTSGRSMGASQTRPGPPADLRLRWHQLERSLGQICVLLKVSRPDETIRELTTVLCFLILEI